MGSASSTRWRGYEKRLAVEMCRRISVREATVLGLSVATRPAPNGAAWPYCHCLECGRLVRFLYQRPDAEPWLCRRCHGLNWGSQQNKGTAAALATAVSQSEPEFLRWLNSRSEWVQLQHTDLQAMVKPGCPVTAEILAIERQIAADNLKRRLRPLFLAQFKREWKAKHRTYNRRRQGAHPPR